MPTSTTSPLPTSGPRRARRPSAKPDNRAPTYLPVQVGAPAALATRKTIQRGSTFAAHPSVVVRAMSDFANEAGGAGGPIRPTRGSTFLSRAPVEVRAMRDFADQTDGTGPTSSGSAEPMTAEPMQEALSLDRDHEIRENRERAEGIGGTVKSQREIVAEAVELAVRAGRLLQVMGLSSSLAGSLIFNLPLYFSSPSQNLNLRPSSIWLSRAENDLRTWPLGVRGSVYLRSRKGAYRTPNGRLFGPIGRLFRPSGHDYFGVALMSAWPCVGQACASDDRQVMDSFRLGHLLLCRRQRRSSALRLCLRPSLHLWLHRPIEPKAPKRRSQCGLRAWRFADISTQPPGQNIKWIRRNLIVLSILSASLALAACAIAFALAPQRFAGPAAPIALGATAIASALATHPLIASALASQRSGSKRPRAWRLA